MQRTSIASSSATSGISYQNELVSTGPVTLIHKGRKYKTPVQCRSFIARSDSIYTSLLGSSTPEAEIKKWMESYETDRIEAIKRLLSLLLDSSGYFDFDVSPYVARGNSQYSFMFEVLQNNVPDLVKENQYLFKNTSTMWTERLQEKIADFLCGLFDALYESNALADYVAVTHIIQFIYNMGTSNKRSLRHTGVVLALKLAKTFERMRADIDLQEDDDDPRSQLYKKIFGSVFDAFTTIFRANFLIEDKFLTEMRMACINEMGKLFKTYPNFFFSETYFKDLLKSCLDAKAKVRVLALQTFESLNELPRFQEYILRNLSKVFDIIGGRLVDVNCCVISVAVRILINMIHLNPPTKYKHIIAKIIYDRNYPVSASAARFLVSYLRHGYHNDDHRTKRVILSLARIKRFTDVKGTLTPIFVESCLGFATELQEWEVIFDILETTEFESPDEVENFVGIVCETVRQIVTGRSKIVRLKPRSGTVSEEVNVELRNRMVQNLPAVVEKYKNNGRIISTITRMLLLFDYQTLPEEHIDHMSTILTLFTSSDDTQKNGDILAVLGELLCKISNDSSSLKAVADKIFMQTVYDLSTRFNSCIAENNTTAGFEQFTLVLSKLFDKADLTSCFEWNQLYGLVDDSSELVFSAETFASVLICCQCFITWQFKGILKSNENLANGLTVIKDQLSALTKTCYHTVETCEYSGPKIIALQCICKTYIELKKDIARHPDVNPLLQKFLRDIKFGVEELGTLLVSFTEEIILGKYSCTRVVRQQSLVGALSMLLASFFPRLEISRLTQHAYSLKDECGHIFTNMLLKRAANRNIVYIALTVIDAVRYRYSRLKRAKGDHIDLNSAHSEGIMKLAAHFRQELKGNIDTLIMVVHLGINYVAQERNYDFLYFMKPFVKQFSPENAKIIVIHIEKKITTEDGTNKYLQNFLKYLGTRC